MIPVPGYMYLSVYDIYDHSYEGVVITVTTSMYSLPGNETIDFCESL